MNSRISSGYVCGVLGDVTVTVNPTRSLSVELQQGSRLEGVLEKDAELCAVLKQSSTLEAVLDQRRYAFCPPEPEVFSIASFNGPSTPVELGALLSSPAFTASYNNGAPTVATLTDNDGNAPTDVSGTPTAFNAPFIFQKSTIGQSVTWNLEATLNAEIDNEQHTVSWLPRVFTGVTSSPGPYTEAQIEALATQALKTSAAISTQLSPVNQYIVHAYPASYGPKNPVDFQIGNLGPGDMTEIQTALSITNANSVTLPYRVARSDNLLDINLGGGSPVDFLVT